MGSRFAGGWFLASAAALLLAGCSDPAAVQDFAAAAPPAAAFHDLMTESAALPLQRAALDRVVLAGLPTQGTDAARQQTARLCVQAAALAQMHAAMAGYMATLGALATTGAAATGGAATPAAKQVVASIVDPCPPPPQPAASGAAAQGKSATGGSTDRTSDIAETPQAASLTTSLEGLASTDPRLGVSRAQADAAGSLAALVTDAATLGLRQQALRAAFVAGHDGFLAAIHIERSAVTWNLSCAAGSASGLTDYRDDLDGVLTQLSGYVDTDNPRTAPLAARLQLDLLRGSILPPARVAAFCTAARTYAAALASLRSAYLALYDAAVHGAGVLTPAMQTRLQPILNDVAAAYGGLSKL